MELNTGNTLNDFQDIKIKYDEELVEIGYSNVKIKYNILEVLDKTMASQFGFDINSNYDYRQFKTNIKDKTPVVNSDKPGLATLFKQGILTIGDILGFLFKLVKDGIDQIINSFIMPILTPAMPYSMPIIVQKIIEIIKKIMDMVKEAISIVTDTLNWLLEKVAGKLMSVKIPIPSFSIPMFGLEIKIPSIDKLKMLKVEPFPSLPTEKISNFASQISKIKKDNINLPINDLHSKLINLQKIKDIGKEIDNLTEIGDNDVKKMETDLKSLNYKIAEIKDSRSDINKNFLDNSLILMESCLQVLKNMLFASTNDLIQVIIDTHNDVIIKKKNILDEYLTELVKNGKGIKIDYNNLNNIETQLKSQNIILSNYTSGISLGVVSGNDIVNMNSDTNYIINLNSIASNIVSTDGTVTGQFIKYKADFITYTFTNRLSVYQKEYDFLNKNKTVYKEYKKNNKEYKKGAKTNIVYTYNDYEYLKYISGHLVDEIEKEEADLEEDINRYKIEDIPTIKVKIDALNDLLDKPYIKQLKKDEQYRTPILSDVEKAGYIKIGKEIPLEDILVTELKIEGYRNRIVSQYNNINDIYTQIKLLEKTIIEFKDRIKLAKIQGGGIKTDEIDKQLKDLKVEKEKLEANLNKISPESTRTSKMLELLLQILLFPIQLIVGLLAELMGGIVDFITSLPLLNFEKLMSFFENLFKLPSKSGMADMITKVIGDATSIPDSALKSVTNVVSGASESISKINNQYIEEYIVKPLPFNVVELVKDAPQPISEEGSINIYDQNYIDFLKKYYIEHSNETQSVDNSFEDETNYDSVNYSGQKGSKNINLLHPSIRQLTLNMINDVNKMLKNKYNASFIVSSTYRSPEYQRYLRDKWDSGERQGLKVRPAEFSYHSAGLAFDGKITINSKDAMDDVISFFKTRGFRWGGEFNTFDPVHWQYEKFGTVASISKNGVFKENNNEYPNIA